jgi:hypothetical protein
MRLLLSALLSCAAQLWAQDFKNPDDMYIGFDLKYGYGTASISYPNGSSTDVAKVESGDEYRATFRKLSLPGNAHYAYASS